MQDAFLCFGSGVCYKLVGAKTLVSCVINYSYFLDHNQNQWFYANDEKVYLYLERYQ